MRRGEHTAGQRAREGLWSWHSVPEQTTFEVTNWGHRRTLTLSKDPHELIAFYWVSALKCSTAWQNSSTEPQGHAQTTSSQAFTRTLASTPSLSHALCSTFSSLSQKTYFQSDAAQSSFPLPLPLVSVDPLQLLLLFVEWASKRIELKVYVQSSDKTTLRILRGQ